MILLNVLCVALAIISIWNFVSPLRFSDNIPMWFRVLYRLFWLFMGTGILVGLWRFLWS